MTSPQPRRTRRRTAPATSLPRPVAGEGSALSATHTATVRPGGRTREHHVMDDFTYVRKDLATVAVVGSICLGLVVAVSFLY